MTALSRTSKRCGVTCTIALHGLILLLCFLLAGQATPTPLPPAVESIRISLTDPAASEAQRAEAVEPEAPAALPEPEPEPPAPPVVEDAIPVAKKVEEKPKKEPRKPKKPVAEQAKAAAPQPARSAEQSAAPDAAVKEARQTLLSALIARIEREKRYPTAARRLGLEGKVTAVVHVDAQGRIISVQVKGAPAHAVLEKAALESLNRVRDAWNPVPVPVPQAMTLHIPILYSLKTS